MANFYEFLPELEGEEALYIKKLLSSLSDDDAKTFTNIYKARRKDPMTILILTAIGFFGVAGIHRILLGHIGMGILYLFTAGLCLIGSVVDIINYKTLTFDYNMSVAKEIVLLMDVNNNS